ncbi:MAG TPA: hypothetical protein PLU35_02140 [Phycisphaerales bacterium]|nr:hypothetical protein [Phycisphaerales bacterium]
MGRCASVRRGNVGFGLIVLLIVLAIGMIVYFGVGGGSTGLAQQAAKSRDMARDVRTAVNTKQLAMLISQFREENGHLPSSPAEVGGTRGAFNDQWGTEMRLDFVERPGFNTRVVFVSAGPDGEFGTGDDVRYEEELPF